MRNLRHAAMKIGIGLLTALLPALSSCGGGGSNAPSGSPTYTVTYLAAIKGDPQALNNNGQIAGVRYNVGPADGPHGFFYSDGTLVDVGLLPTSRGSIAHGLNDQGQVVGTSYPMDNFLHAFLWQNGQTSDLSTSALRFYEAYAINNGGQVAGTCGQFLHACLWDNGRVTDLGTIGNVSGNSQARDINDAMQVVGSSPGPAGSEHAFLWQAGRMTDLGALSSTGSSSAYKINSMGQVVGQADVGTKQHAFLWQNGQMTDLGTLPAPFDNSQAADINISGQIIGESYAPGATGPQTQHAFLYTGGKMYDLNTLIPSNSGWVLEWARSINDRGQIVGTGQYNGQGGTFLLTPK